MKTPKWYYEEKQIGVDYLDSKIAEKYDDEHQKFRDFNAEAQDVVDKLEITEEDIVLDFGCGTGGIALNLAKYCKKVICVDISQQMLDILKTKAEEQNITNIETHCAGFLTYKHEGDKVDKVISKFALHHLPDFWKSVALLRIADILKTGGKFYLFDVIFTFNPEDYKNSFNEFIETLRNDGGDSMADETMIHIKDEFSTYDWIMEGLFEKTGFSIDLKEIEAENCISYICSKV
ncbi:MAG: methyltransferase domain-containing protein [Methanobacterium sp.]|uniref:class I SAM-dependent methyltransferase n=1 Tax=Methanobacterium sp. TaxID=2164 RepID=UPI003D6463F3|nr:methyltransferase domain-containing protein [Methanobacterium sp.]